MQAKTASFYLKFAAYGCKFRLPKALLEIRDYMSDMMPRNKTIDNIAGLMNIKMTVFCIRSKIPFFKHLVLP